MLSRSVTARAIVLLLCTLAFRPLHGQEIGRLELTKPESSRDAVKRMIAQHEYGRAGEELGRLLAGAPEDHELLVLQALNFFHEHKYPESRSIVARLIDGQSATADVRVLSGLLFVLSSEPGSAENEFRAATQADGQNAAAHYYLGRALYMRQAIVPSVAEFERAITLDANFIQAYDALGLAYLVMEKPADAKAWFERGMRQEESLGGAKNEWLRLDLATMLLTYRRAAEAAVYLADAERINATNPQVYTELGQMYFQQHRYADALAAYGQVLKLDPSNALAHYFRGRAFHFLKDDERAKEEFQWFITLNRQHTMNETGASFSAH